VKGLKAAFSSQHSGRAALGTYPRQLAANLDFGWRSVLTLR
jgi:hypothetical protein